MRQTLVINKKQETELQQILSELIFSLKKTYSEEDLMSLSYFIIKESGKQTFNSKKDTTIKLFKAVGKFSGKTYSSAKNKAKLYNKYGFKTQLANDLINAKKSLSDTPENIKYFGQEVKKRAIGLNENFLKKSKDEKIELISVGLMGILIFFASAGGEDFEGGLPDSDLNLGIGFHRHFMSHSIIMGFIIEFLMRSGVELINKSYKNLPQTHHSFWDKTNNYINKHKGVAIGAMWAGISAHLLKDSGILGHGIKPYNGLPIEMSMTAHQGLFAANSTASAIFAHQDIKKSH